jgi:phosphate transport system substrate-binding protein
MTDDQLARTDRRILHFPVALNAIVPVYNLAQVPELRFSGSTLADVFLGKITTWDAPAIARDNPGVDLPRKDIKVVHEFPGGRAATHVMANYLSKVSSAFEATLASASNADWPVTSSRAGYNQAEGMVGNLMRIPGSIGYLPLFLVRFELARNRQSPLKYAAVRNSEGEFVIASAESVTASGATAAPLLQTEASDFRVYITNAPGKESYPIASFIWLLRYETSEDKKKEKIMTEFLRWVLTDGQKLAVKLGYPPLPSNLVEIELQRLEVSAR